MPLAAALIASVGLVILSLIYLSIPQNAASGALLRNSAVGIRTPETKKSDAGWISGHRAAAPILTGTAIATLALTSVLLGSSLAGEKFNPMAIAAGIAGYAVAIGGVCWAGLAANNAARRINRQKGIE